MKARPAGHFVLESDKFCRKCGVELITVPDKFCGKCKTRLFGGEKYCAQCGIRIDVQS